MDDAGGGRRGTRAEVSADLRELLRHRYGIAAQQGQDLGGSLNLNLLVRRGDERLVVRVYRPSVGDARLADIQYVRNKLDAAGIPCSALMTADDGAPRVRLGNRMVEVERFIEHDGRMNTSPLLVRSLPILGRIHSVLRNETVSTAGRNVAYANHIEAADALTVTRAGTTRIRGWSPSAEERELAQESDRLAGLVDAGERPLTAALPRQLVHGDFWDNNVFILNNAPIFIADFDFMAERPRIDDLALTLHFAEFAFRLTEPNARIASLRPLVQAYLSGLDEPLSEVEREALPWALARQPLWGVGGWIAVLDDENAARDHAHGMLSDVRNALQIVTDIQRWQRDLFLP